MNGNLKEKISERKFPNFPPKIARSNFKNVNMSLNFNFRFISMFYVINFVSLSLRSCVFSRIIRKYFNIKLLSFQHHHAEVDTIDASPKGFFRVVSRRILLKCSRSSFVLCITKVTICYGYKGYHLYFL
jgi:hypothetical protein